MLKTIERVEPWLLMISLPLFLFPEPWMWPMAMIPVTCCLGARVGRGRGTRGTASVPLAALALLAGISLAITPLPSRTFPKVMGLWFGLWACDAVVRWIGRDLRRAQTAVRMQAAAGLALAVIALVGANWIEKISGLAVITDRLPALLRGIPGAEDGAHPNAIAGVLVLILPIQIALARMPNSARAWWLIVAVTAGTLVLTQSRGAWAGVAASALVAGLLLGRWQRGLTVAAILAGVMALTWAPARGAVLPLLGRGLVESASGRLAVFDRAITAVDDFPWTGIGVGTFRDVMPQLYPVHSSGGGTDVRVAHAHNQWLQTALDIGWPGLFAYLGCWVVAGRSVVRSRRSCDASVRTWASGLGAGLVAHLVFGLTDAIPLGAKLGLLFWTQLGCAVGLCGVISSPPGRDPGEAPLWAKGHTFLR